MAADVEHEKEEEEAGVAEEDLESLYHCLSVAIVNDYLDLLHFEQRTQQYKNAELEYDHLDAEKIWEVRIADHHDCGDGGSQAQGD